MLRKPYLRATVFVVGLGFFIQITGINATVTYGPQIFEAMGVQSDSQKILMSLLVQVFALISVLVSMRYVDRWGRRPILLTGIAVMIVAQLMMVVTFASAGGGDLVGWQIALGFAGLALINVGFVFGFGALVWVYSSESFPARLRSYGSSAMLTSDLIANVIIAQFFLTVLTAIGGAGSFGLFAVLAFIAWIFVFKMAPRNQGSRSGRHPPILGKRWQVAYRKMLRRSHRSSNSTRTVLVGICLGEFLRGQSTLDPLSELEIPDWRKAPHVASRSGPGWNKDPGCNCRQVEPSLRDGSSPHPNCRHSRRCHGHHRLVSQGSVCECWR